jgi:hypothetical protein
MDSYLVSGYYAGLILFFLTMAAIFWFVGRWGWLGSMIRLVVVGLVIVRVLNLLDHLPTA